MRLEAEMVDEVNDLLGRIQEGYTNRDVDNINDYYSKVFSTITNVSVVGTANDEWFIGMKEVKELLRNDWLYWGDLKLNMASLEIQLLTKEVVSFFIRGNVEKILQENKFFDGIMAAVTDEVNNSTSGRTKAIRALRHLSFFLTELDKGSEVVAPIRLTGTLVREESEWRVAQLHFSFGAEVFPPDLRLVDGKPVI